MLHLLLADSDHEPSQDKSRHDEEEIVGHLGVIALQLQGSKESSQRRTGEVFAAIKQRQPADGGWYICQGDKLPDMSRADQDYEIGGESPCHSPEERDIPLHLHAEPHDEEAHHHDKEQIGGIRQTEHKDLAHPVEPTIGLITWGDLEIGHTSEQGVGPARIFAGGFTVVLHLPAVGKTLHRVGLLQHITLHIIGEEKKNGHDGEHRRGQYKIKGFLIHNQRE